jgi:hypothetical protein
MKWSTQVLRYAGLLDIGDLTRWLSLDFFLTLNLIPFLNNS